MTAMAAIDPKPGTLTVVDGFSFVAVTDGDIVSLMKGVSVGLMAVLLIGRA